MPSQKLLKLKDSLISLGGESPTSFPLYDPQLGLFLIPDEGRNHAGTFLLKHQGFPQHESLIALPCIMDK